MLTLLHGKQKQKSVLYFKAVDGFKLNFIVDRAKQAQAQSLFLHSYGEHIQHYNGFVSELNHIGMSFTF
ncbi:MAG: hypothetical protein CL916_08340 [Deltaproteobacteria bacterium]|nr:hypothetical protein [Deltaproteobacteria bacterium]